MSSLSQVHGALLTLVSRDSVGYSTSANPKTAMLVGTRTLYGLAQEGHAPKLFTRLNRFGVPWMSVAAVGSFLALGYMTLSSAASVVFDWLQQLVSAASLVHWINIEVIYLRFFYGCKKQKISRTELPWKSPFQPYAAWISLVSFTTILLTGGFYVFIEDNWSPQTFVSSYFNIPLLFVLYFGYKFWRKTRLVTLEEIPIQEFLHIANENPEPIPSPATGWRRLNILWA
jgi:amino acid transporter